MKSLRTSCIAGVAAAVALGLAGAGGAQEREWDQAKVAEIAQELPPAINDVHTALLNEVPPGVAAGQDRAMRRLRDLTRRMRNEARHLATELEAGKGHEDTLPIFENLMVMLRDARVDARRMFRTEPLNEKIATARGVLDQLAPYYDAQPLPPPIDRTPS